MNDLRLFLAWCFVICILVIGIWGLDWHESSEARPNAVENRSFRAANKVVLLGKPLYIPWKWMLAGWGLAALSTLALWPWATRERANRWLGRWARHDGEGGSGSEGEGRE